MENIFVGGKDLNKNALEKAMPSLKFTLSKHL